MNILNTTLQDVKPCRLVEVYRRFGGIYYLHLQSRIVGQASSEQGDTSVNVYQTTRRHIIEDGPLHSHRSENLEPSLKNIRL
jgi:hypothetical protein